MEGSTELKGQVDDDQKMYIYIYVYNIYIYAHVIAQSKFFPTHHAGPLPQRRERQTKGAERQLDSYGRAWCPFRVAQSATGENDL